MEVLHGLQLHVEQVADAAMGVGGVADAVELEIGVAQAGLGGLLAELEAPRELDAVCGGLYAVVPNLAGVTNRIQEVGRDGRLAAGELHGHLAFGLDGDGVVEQGLDLLPAQLVDEVHLVGVHKTRVAHHVAAVGEVDGEHRSAAVGDGAGAVVVQPGVVVRAHIAAGEHGLDVPVEGRIDRHRVFEVAVDEAVLDHQDPAIALDDLGLDLAHLFVEEVAVVFPAVQDLPANCRHALRAERIGFARPT